MLLTVGRSAAAPWREVVLGRATPVTLRWLMLTHFAAAAFTVASTAPTDRFHISNAVRSSCTRGPFASATFFSYGSWARLYNSAGCLGSWKTINFQSPERMAE